MRSMRLFHKCQSSYTFIDRREQTEKNEKCLLCKRSLIATKLLPQGQIHFVFPKNMTIFFSNRQSQLEQTTSYQYSPNCDHYVVGRQLRNLNKKRIKSEKNAQNEGLYTYLVYKWWYNSRPPWFILEGVINKVRSSEATSFVNVRTKM